MQIDDAATILAEADFFDICTDDERRLLAFASERKFFPAGDPIFMAGDVPTGAHILVSGTITLAAKGDPNPRTVSSPGTIVNAIALIVARPREIDVVAVNIVETLLVPRSAFLKLLNQSPDLAQKAAERIRGELIQFMTAVTETGKKFR
jgi:CRP-like cAMP-binding protein